VISQDRLAIDALDSRNAGRERVRKAGLALARAQKNLATLEAEQATLEAICESYKDQIRASDPAGFDAAEATVKEMVRKRKAHEAMYVEPYSY